MSRDRTQNLVGKSVLRKGTNYRYDVIAVRGGKLVLYGPLLSHLVPDAQLGRPEDFEEAK